MAHGGRRCSWVHDTLMVDPRGDVYACCHHLPGVVGNIYEAPLKQIYNGDEIRKFRRQEIDGTLACAAGCTLQQSAGLPDGVHHDYHADLSQLLIEFGEFCNIACIMCTQKHDSKLELDPEIVVRQIELPKSALRVTFYGGEPLILKSAKAFFDHCAAHDTKVSFITNGTAITADMAAKIALHCRVINFSLNAASRRIHELVNAGSNFDRVLRNVKRVIEAKRELKTRVIIMGHMTIVDQNVHEVAEFIGKRAEFGFEYLNFSYDRKVPAFLARNPELQERLVGEIRSAIAADFAIGRKFTATETPRIDTGRLRALGLA